MANNDKQNSITRERKTKNKNPEKNKKLIKKQRRKIKQVRK